jgi:hypothetical protein
LRSTGGSKKIDDDAEEDFFNGIGPKANMPTRLTDVRY